MADAQDLKIHFTLFQPVAHHRLPHSQTIDNELVVSVYAFFHSVEKGRGSDPKSSTKSSTDPKQTQKYLLKSCASGKGIFPAARSRVVIRLAQGRKAKPNANTRTLRPDKCLVVKSLDSSLRPVCPSQHGVHRRHHQEARNSCNRLRRTLFSQSPFWRWWRWWCWSRHALNKWFRRWRQWWWWWWWWRRRRRALRFVRHNLLLFFPLPSPPFVDGPGPLVGGGTGAGIPPNATMTPGLE